MPKTARVTPSNELVLEFQEVYENFSESIIKYPDGAGVPITLPPSYPTVVMGVVTVIDGYKFIVTPFSAHI